jgi:hypothetical protein
MEAQCLTDRLLCLMDELQAVIESSARALIPLVMAL